MDPKNLRYAATHEWAILEGNTCILGITKFAVEQLTDVVYIELPERKLFAVDLDVRDGTLAVGVPRPLLGGQPVPDLPFDITADGKRLLVAMSTGESDAPHVNLVTNWTRLLERR